MSLRERLNAEPPLNAPGVLLPNRMNGELSNAFTAAPDLQETKARLHRSIINRLDLSKINQLSPEQTHTEVARIAREILLNEDTPLSTLEKEQLIEDVRG